MKTPRTLFATLILAAGFGGVALAQPGGPGMMGGSGCDGAGPGKMGRLAAMNVDPAERIGKRLDYQKYQLKITAAQESLWSAYADKLKSEAGKGFQAMRAQSGDANLAAPERMAKMQAAMQERLTAMAGVHESFNRLYEALSPEQKKIADQQAAEMGPRAKDGGRRGPPSAAQG